MLMLPSSQKVLIYRDPVDMRRSFDGLELLVREHLGADPLSGTLFVFRNRRGDRVKLLLWDGTGFWIWYKRLEGGTFRLPAMSSVGEEVAASDLVLMLEGIDLAGARRQRRWRREFCSKPLKSKAQGVTLRAP
jgi:transposase